MGLLNSSGGYGALSKLFHWLIVVMFAMQYVSAAIMVRMTPDGTMLGAMQSDYYNWHKSAGLMALLIAVARLVNRRAGELPPWAPTLTPLEQTIIHRAEQLLYGAMLVMPLSGLLYVMAGGYGVRLFGIVDIYNPLGSMPVLAVTARFVHVVAAFLLLLPLGAHLGLVLGHHFGIKDKLLDRMLPERRNAGK